jgi:hypothetical protein
MAASTTISDSFNTNLPTNIATSCGVMLTASIVDMIQAVTDRGSASDDRRTTALHHV